MQLSTSTPRLTVTQYGLRFIPSNGLPSLSRSTPVLTVYFVLCSHGTDEVLSPDVYQPLIEQLDQGASFFSTTLMISPLLPPLLPLVHTT